MSEQVALLRVLDAPATCDLDAALMAYLRAPTVSRRYGEKSCGRPKESLGARAVSIRGAVGELRHEYR